MGRVLIGKHKWSVLHLTCKLNNYRTIMYSAEALPHKLIVNTKIYRPMLGSNLWPFRLCIFWWT